MRRGHNHWNVLFIAPCLVLLRDARIAGWYFKSVEAAIFTTAASQGVTQGLSVGANTSSKCALALLICKM